MMVTQNVLDGLGMVSDPQKNTIKGNGNDKKVAVLAWFRKIAK